MKQSSINRETLKKRLAVLVDDFGYDKVHKVLDGIQRTSAHTTKCNPTTAKAKANYLARKKPDAITIVTSLDIADADKRDFLLHLARDYENKQFMPNVTHVRGFLMNIHEHPSRIKSRQQVTIKVFKQLATMSVEELRELEFCGVYGPPKRLATYAEAIGNFARDRRVDKDRDKDNVSSPP